MSIIHLLSKCYWKLKNKDTKMIETSPCCHIAYNIMEELKKKQTNKVRCQNEDKIYGI